MCTNWAHEEEKDNSILSLEASPSLQTHHRSYIYFKAPSLLSHKSLKYFYSFFFYNFKFILNIVFLPETYNYISTSEYKNLHTKKSILQVLKKLTKMQI